LPALLERTVAALEPPAELARAILAALVDEPPAVVGRAPLIRAGYHEEVDRLRAIRSDGKGWIAAFEAAERARTGIPNLKIAYNKVFGYFIEVSRSMQARVPADYARKQTVANAERYVTDELKRRESELLGAEDRLAALESHLFSELVAEAAAHLPALTRSAAALAVVDVLAGWAETAHRAAHVRPEIDEHGTLEISDGRHPVVEDAIGQRFVPNDCSLSPDAACLVVITGPNMAGKSTYLRQTAIIALLAHCGAFVPAAKARIPLLDRLFTRIGASDDLRRGQSTFMVEMTETASILGRATERSLVVLDEIGRGTSTFDGISIAWAVAEALVARAVKTLFATHYHELAGLAGEHDRVRNRSVAVRRYKGEIVFLYRVVEGAASGSFGIEVARLAGVPAEVIEKARQMLARFESEPGPERVAGEVQPSLFAAPAAARSPRAAATDALVAELAAVNVERLTPLDALNMLDRLVREARDRQD
jgi:DNA mismatch repair protein MutS